MDRINEIKRPDNKIFLAAKARWDSVAKPKKQYRKLLQFRKIRT